MLGLHHACGPFTAELSACSGSRLCSYRCPCMHKHWQMSACSIMAACWCHDSLLASWQGSLGYKHPAGVGLTEQEGMQEVLLAC